MANISFNISLDYPEVASATKRIEKSQSNILLRIVQEITVKGKLLALNNQSGYNQIWQQINLISDNAEAKNCSLNFLELNSYEEAKILNISFEDSNSQDVKSKNFSITFEVYEAIPNSLLTNYGVNVLDLKDITDIKISQAIEENLEGKTLTTAIGITFAENAKTCTLNRAQMIATEILANLAILIVTTASRTTVSNIYDETTGTYTFIETKNEFRGSIGGFAILRSNNYNIQANGSIVASENGQIKIEKNDNFTISQIQTKAIIEADGAKSRCQAFTSNYYNLAYGSIPAGYRTSFEETTRQISIDEAAGTAQYSISITNEPEYVGDVRVEITDTIEDLKKEKAKRKIVRGTIVGMKNPPNKEISLTSNKKLTAAKNYFDAKYKGEFLAAKDITEIQQKIGNNKTYITNGDITYNISEGSINFSLTYEDRPEYVVSNTDLIYGSAEITNQSAVHLANQFLILGGLQPGEEIIQETSQSKPIEKNLKVEAFFKDASKIKSYISNFKDLVKNNYLDGVLTSLSISSNLIGRTFQGSATWFNFGNDRSRTDTAIKVTNPDEIKI